MDCLIFLVLLLKIFGILKVIGLIREPLLFLIEILKKEYAAKNLNIFRLEEFKINEMDPKYFDVNAIPIPALMLQTGYLTILWS
ncbi:MAG: hypothetical protein JSS09_05075 [Verrucomicrobia bacterium]|nr:hypothetical protein [Verrucomicrobiota bacterium]